GETAKRESGIDIISQTGVPGALAFELYDTYGFPLDMTQLLATERGLTADVEGFNELKEQQRERARAAQKKEIIVAATDSEETNVAASKFLGYTETKAHGTLTDVVSAGDDTFLVFDQTPFYAEMGGQAGDCGHVLINDQMFTVVDTVKDKSGRHLHKIEKAA